MSEVSQIEAIVDSFEEWVLTENAEKTAKSYVGAAHRWLEFLDSHNKTVWEVDSGDLRRFVREMIADEYSAKYIKSRFYGISVFYQDLAKMKQEEEYIGVNLPDEIPENPAEDIDLTDFKYLRRADKDTKTKKSLSGDADFRYLERDEYKEMCDNVEKPKFRNELIFRLLVRTGMRRGELAKVRLKDITHESREIYIPPRKSPDGRTVRYPPNLKFMVDTWVDVERKTIARADDSEFLFPTQRSDHISPEEVNRIVKRAADNAGFQSTKFVDKRGQERKTITAHTCRHTFGSWNVLEGMPVRLLQELMGHEKIETTERYLKVKESDALSAMDQFAQQIDAAESGE